MNLFDQPTRRRRANDAWPLVMRAARTLAGAFTLPDLAIACWQLAPAEFGLPGHLGHADVHKVASIVYGERGLVACGLLRKVGKGVFEVPAGQDISSGMK